MCSTKCVVLVEKTLVTYLPCDPGAVSASLILDTHGEGCI